MKFSNFEYGQIFQFDGHVVRKVWNGSENRVEFEVKNGKQWDYAGVSYQLDMIQDFEAMFPDGVKRLDTMIGYQLEANLNV